MLRIYGSKGTAELTMKTVTLRNAKAKETLPSDARTQQCASADRSSPSRYKCSSAMEEPMPAKELTPSSAKLSARARSKFAT